MWKNRLISLFLVLLMGFSIFWLYYTNTSKNFKLGLDLAGGSYLVYKADLSRYQENELEIEASMESLREVLQNRVNSLDASAANVSTEIDRFASGGKEYRVVVELPGVTDLQQAIKILGDTPVLEFKLANPDYDPASAFKIEGVTADGQSLDLSEGNAESSKASQEPFIETGLTGEFLENASVQFQQQSSASGLAGTPIIALQFNQEGKDLFAEITGNNVGEVLGIFLDGVPISLPVIQTEISNGEAIITGQFTPEEAKELAGRLNSGALPIPIELIRTETVGPILGQEATNAGVMAGIYSLILVSVFMIAWYRIPGLIAVVSLIAYSVLSLLIYKYGNIILTAGGIVGFVISLGMAVDANILIAERIKEEIKGGQTLYDAMRVGFKRAWSSIRDANVSSLISALVLFWLGTPLIKSFAVTFGLGVLVSMLTAVSLSRIFLMSIQGNEKNKFIRFLFSSGFFNKS